MGETKYPLLRMLRLAGDGLLSFFVVSLRIAIWLGLATALLVICGILYAVALRLTTNIWVEGWTFQVVSTFFHGGV